MRYIEFSMTLYPKATRDINLFSRTMTIFRNSGYISGILDKRRKIKSRNRVHLSVLSKR